MATAKPAGAQPPAWRGSEHRRKRGPKRGAGRPKPPQGAGKRPARRHAPQRTPQGPTGGPPPEQSEGNAAHRPAERRGARTPRVCCASSGEGPRCRPRGTDGRAPTTPPGAPEAGDTAGTARHRQAGAARGGHGPGAATGRGRPARKAGGKQDQPRSRRPAEHSPPPEEAPTAEREERASGGASTAALPVTVAPYNRHRHPATTAQPPRNHDVIRTQPDKNPIKTPKVPHK